MTNDVAAWVRKHPDGSMTDEVLMNWLIDAVRKESGAWQPLCSLSVLNSTLDALADEVEISNELRLQVEALGASVAVAHTAKNEATTHEIHAEQEADELRASLKNVVNHWREFGPDHGFDECIERAAGRRAIDA